MRVEPEFQNNIEEATHFLDKAIEKIEPLWVKTFEDVKGCADPVRSIRLKKRFKEINELYMAIEKARDLIR